MTYSVNGTYGGNQTPCTIFCYEQDTYTWYVAEGSKNINCTLATLTDGVDIEYLEDVDTITAFEEIESIDELVQAVKE